MELCGGLLDDLASLLHRVALVRGSVPERDPSLPRLLQGLAGLLGNVARRRPLVVVLDDVHHADASSWQALRYFARHLDDARLLVLATSRPAELAGHDVAAQVLFELDQDALLSRLEVAPLGRRGVSELAEAVIERPAPRALVDWLVERSQGNPLFAIGLLRALLDERADLADPHLRRLPEGLTERVTSQLRRFDAAPRGLLERLAVVGRPVSLGDLTALTSSSLEEVGPTLARARRGGHRRRGGARQPAQLRALSPARARRRLPGDERRDAARAAPPGGALAAARRVPGGGGGALRPLGRARRLGGGRGAAGRDAPGRAAGGVPARRSTCRPSSSSCCRPTTSAGWRCSRRCTRARSG